MHAPPSQEYAPCQTVQVSQSSDSPRAAQDLHRRTVAQLLCSQNTGLIKMNSWLGVRDVQVMQVIARLYSWKPLGAEKVYLLIQQ